MTPSTSDLRVSVLQTTPAPEDKQRRGLIAWLVLALNDAIAIDGVTLRRTRAGAYSLSFPKRAGKHPVVRLLNQAVREEFETQVFRALELERELAE